MDFAGFISLFGLSAIELWLGIPLGFALKINPVLIFCVSAAGSTFSAATVIFAGGAIRKALLKNKNESAKQGRAALIWQKFGAAGLGLLSPFFFGAPFGAAIGIALGAEKKKLLFWMVIGIILWSAALTAAGTAGINAFRRAGQ